MYEYDHPQLVIRIMLFGSPPTNTWKASKKLREGSLPKKRENIDLSKERRMSVYLPCWQQPCPEFTCTNDP